MTRRPNPWTLERWSTMTTTSTSEAVGTQMTMMIRREARISPASKTPFKRINNDFAFTITYSDGCRQVPPTYSDVVAKYLLRHPVDGLDSPERVSNSLSCRAAFSSTGPSSQRRRGHNGDALASDSVNVVPPFLRAVNVSFKLISSSQRSGTSEGEGPSYGSCWDVRRKPLCEVMSEGQPAKARKGSGKGMTGTRGKREVIGSNCSALVGPVQQPPLEGMPEG